MNRYSGFCDEHYLNMNLSTEMTLPSNRDTLLHFFEQLRKKFPAMKNFYSRDPGEFVLEQEKSEGQQRWATVEAKRLSSGLVNPDSIEGAIEQHVCILSAAPHLLSVSPIDCETLNLTYGFDFGYRGNQHQLIADTFGLPYPFEKAMETPGAKMIGFDPSIQMSLSEDGRVQCRISIEPRTSAYQIRTNDFPEENLSVYVTLRKYGSVDSGATLESEFQSLVDQGEQLMDDFIIQEILVPMQKAIAL